MASNSDNLETSAEHRCFGGTQGCAARSENVTRSTPSSSVS